MKSDIRIMLEVERMLKDSFGVRTDQLDLRMIDRTLYITIDSDRVQSQSVNLMLRLFGLPAVEYVVVTSSQPDAICYGHNPFVKAIRAANDMMDAMACMSHATGFFASAVARGLKVT